MIPIDCKITNFSSYLYAKICISKELLSNSTCLLKQSTPSVTIKDLKLYFYFSATNDGEIFTKQIDYTPLCLERRHAPMSMHL